MKRLRRQFGQQPGSASFAAFVPMIGKDSRSKRFAIAKIVLIVTDQNGSEIMDGKTGRETRLFCSHFVEWEAVRGIPRFHARVNERNRLVASGTSLTTWRKPMARRDALERLHSRLVSQRDALRDQLAGQRSRVVVHDVGDAGDAATEGYEHEIDTQLAAFEAGELRKIDAAIRAIREGVYGTCFVCEKSIPIERLRALPYTTLCVKCQTNEELHGPIDRATPRDWSAAFAKSSEEPREVSLADLTAT